MYLDYALFIYKLQKYSVYNRTRIQCKHILMIIHFDATGQKAFWERLFFLWCHQPISVVMPSYSIKWHISDLTFTVWYCEQRLQNTSLPEGKHDSSLTIFNWAACNFLNITPDLGVNCTLNGEFLLNILTWNEVVPCRMARGALLIDSDTVHWRTRGYGHILFHWFSWPFLVWFCIGAVV